MPIYEYQCQSCGNRSEAMQRMSDPPLETCEDCGGDLRKLISAPAFQFKGSGWYVTDYAKSGDKGKGKEASSGGSEAKESKKSDTDSGGDSSGGNGGDKPAKTSETVGKTKSERIVSDN